MNRSVILQTITYNYFRAKIILVFSFLFLLDYNHLIQKFNHHYLSQIRQKNRIFTFWEPKDKIPGYLQLCMKTWKKALPEYEIVILDYQNVKEYLGEQTFHNIICKDMSLPIQADAIRVAILYKFGGIWMDADNIMLNGTFIKELKNVELAMIGEDKANIYYIGFIYALSNSRLLKDWLNEIIISVKEFRQVIYNKNVSKSKKVSFNKITWNYLGNRIIDENIIKALPERKFFNNTLFNNFEQYRLFYFIKREPQIILNYSKHILLLHNSWTPIVYKNMEQKEFLKQDILLSKILSLILK